MEIRDATPADLPGLRRCAALAFSPWIAAIGRPPAPMEADLAALVSAGRVRVAVQDDGALLGYAVFYAEDGAMTLDTVAVPPAAQGRGLGRALIADCEAAAWARGLDRVRLYTNAAMTRNLALYPRLGYRETGRRTEAGFDRVFFEKRLGG